MKSLTGLVRGQWTRVDRPKTASHEAEWWVCSDDADPRSGAGVPYAEAVHAVEKNGSRPRLGLHSRTGL